MLLSIDDEIKTQKFSDLFKSTESVGKQLLEPQASFLIPNPKFLPLHQTIPFDVSFLKSYIIYSFIHLLIHSTCIYWRPIIFSENRLGTGKKWSGYGPCYY